ncbi:M48 family metallopeptidase [Tistrella bauzanensis]|uniref:Protease HtpX homolog n=1 Tax=Tistrella arctica TaxID=3133430 RepID=A0ABU9YQX0_9PROT
MAMNDVAAAEQADDLPQPVEGPRIDRTDFASAIRANRRRSLMICAGLTLLGVVLGYLVGFVILPPEDVAAAGGAQVGGPGDYAWLLTGGGAVGAAAMAAAGGLWSVLALTRGDRMALSIAGARDADPVAHRRLHNVVEEMALAAGLPKPRVMVIDTDMPNAFAAGLRPERGTIAVTRGLMERLSRDQLQAVVAHEMGHLANGDSRYMVVVSVVVGLIVIVASIARNMARFGALSGGSRRGRGGDRGGGGGNAALVVIALVLMLVAFLAPLAAQMMKFALSRQREYLADATAVKLTRNPQAMIGALDQLDRAAAETSRAAPVSARALEALWIVNPLDGPGESGRRRRPAGLFSTHPAIEDRIDRIRAMA